MSNSKVIVALDIGSSKIRTIVGLIDDSKKNVINIIGVGISPSEGVRRGAVIDMDEATSNIINSLDDAEQMAGESIHSVYVGISGTHIKTYDTQGVIAINSSNSEITNEDTERVLDAARTVHFPSNRDILRVIPRSFTVDSQRQVKFPVGMNGIRLEVEAHIITGESSVIKNIDKCLYRTGLDKNEFIPSILSCAEAVVDRRQKELGVLVIEIGASSTNFVVFEEGTIIHSSVVPIGGGHITNDLALGLRCTIDTAEKVKIEYGNCLIDEVGIHDEIDLSKISKDDFHAISKKEVVNIIEARYREILSIVKEKLIEIGKAKALPGGVVLCGGTVKIAGCATLTREILELPVQIGRPQGIEGMVERIDDPSFAHAVGVLHFAVKYGTPPSFFDFNFDFFFEKIKSFFSKLLP